MSAYEDIRVERDGSGIVTLTIAREQSANRFRIQTTLELADALRAFRGAREDRVLILTGEGERFFCIGGEHEDAHTTDASAALPIIDVYELLDAIPKPIIAAVNGYAVGGGNVLHTICDLTIAAEHAVFRQVGPMVGSFDPGFGTWYLEEAIGRKRAKEMWYLNHKYDAQQALAMGLVNEVVPAGRLMERCRELAGEMLERSPAALAGLKAAFSSKHTGVLGQARMGHDLLLTRYLESEEAHEMSAAFAGKRAPDPSKFGR